MGVAVDGRRQRTIASHTAILDASERLFSSQGFHAASLRSIAAEAGMSHAGLLKHFPNKGTLLAGVLERFEAEKDAHSAALGDIPVRDRLLRLARFMLSRAETVQVSIALLGDAIEPDHPGHAYVVHLLDAVESAIGADGVDVVAAWNGLELLWLYLPDRVDPPAILESFVDTAPALADNPLADIHAPAKHEQASEPLTREQQIVAAAASAFAHHGYRATGLRDIASSLGLSHSALLYHFRSKVELLKAVLEERDRDESLPWTLGDSPLDYLNGMYLQAVHNESSPELGRLFSTLVCEATDPGHPAHEYFAARYTRFQRDLRDVLAALVVDGTARQGIDTDAEAFALIALWDGLALRGFYRNHEIGLPERLRNRIDALLTVKLNHTSITTG